MILILLVLVFLLLYLYLNEMDKNKELTEAIDAEKKKPTAEWYSKKLSDFFFDWKIICDNSNSSRWITYHFKWKYHKWVKEKSYEYIQYWWDLCPFMEDIYNKFNEEKEFRNKMTEQDLFSYILRLKPII